MAGKRRHGDRNLHNHRQRAKLDRRGASASQRATWAAGNNKTYWLLPSENEWYKAAFYKGGSANAGYWTYATQSNNPPTSEPPPGGASSANYCSPTTGYALTQSNALEFECELPDGRGVIPKFAQPLWDARPGRRRVAVERGGCRCRALLAGRVLGGRLLRLGFQQRGPGPILRAVRG